jgi:hypothetical protein
VFNAAGTDARQIISQVAQVFIQIRSAHHAAEDLHAWAAGISRDDLIAAPPNGPGMDPDDADTVLSAVNDAYGQAQQYDQGETTATFPAGYVFGAAQRRVIGSRQN